MTTARVGLLNETRFITEILARGWDVSVPVGNHQPYDLIVDNGYELLRVQVKSTNQDPKSVQLMLQTGTSPNKSRYKFSDFDILAIYIARSEVWYIMPNLGIKKIRLGYENTKYDKYVNNWRMFNEVHG